MPDNHLEFAHNNFSVIRLDLQALYINLQHGACVNNKGNIRRGVNRIDEDQCYHACIRCKEVLS